MKVAVLTILQIGNYGAELQAYATIRHLRKLGFAAEILNYLFYKHPAHRPTPGSAPLWRFNWRRRLKEKLYPLLTACAGFKRRNSRSRFLSDVAAFHAANTPMSEPISTIDELYRRNYDYDAFVVGSDQVWNPGIYSNIKPYWLDFAPAGKKKISYASSFGVAALPPEAEKLYAANLKRFDALSVREDAASKLVKQLTGRDATVVLDPTLMLTPEEWQDVAVRPGDLPDGPYILVYSVSGNPKLWESAQNLSRRTRYPVYPICLRPWTRTGFPPHREPSPGEFVYLLAHAAVILTDSFHGTAFAVNFGIDFYTFVDAAKNNQSRQLGLLAKLGLSNRAVSGSIDQVEPVDFTAPQRRLAELREFSDAYLRAALAETPAPKPEVPQLAAPADCTGCASCVASCGVGAISLLANAEGFAVPKVDAARCVKCRKCEQSCPVVAPPEFPTPATKPVYAAWHRDAAVRRASASGGAFSALAQAVLASGGAVIGAAFDAQLRLRHRAAENSADLPRLRGSKYLQSDFSGVYAQAKQLLSSGRQVLVVGTPCQIAGLYRHFGGKCERLITAELICHGAASPGFFASYVDWLRRDLKFAGITDYRFRDKSSGWYDALRYADGNGKARRMRGRRDDYFYAFNRNYILRDSCYHCRFKAPHSPADLTLGDFWGIGRGQPFESAHEIPDGISLVIPRTPKGRQLLTAAAPYLHLVERSYDEAVAGNHPLIASPKRPALRDKIFVALNRSGFRAAQKLLRRTPKERLIAFIREYLPKSWVLCLRRRA